MSGSTAVRDAIASVDDPEYPGVSIVDLGLLETVAVDASGAVQIGLIPTFSGCPALAMIAADVERAVAAVDGVNNVKVTWLRAPIWTANRLTPAAKTALASDFTVAIQIGESAPACPRCSAPTTEQSMFGPTRCRSVHRCTSCAETVEVMRT